MLEVSGVMINQGSFALHADLALEAGRTYAIIGPSGAGKSTLLLALAGFVDPSVGTMTWRGTHFEGLSPSERPFAMLFQDGNLFPHMSVAQNLGLGLRPSLRMSSDERASVESALEAVGLKGMGTRKPAELSGGQQSRAALARVLVQRKPMILLDEPFAALGPALKTEMLDLVQELCCRIGAGLLMVSHDPNDAVRICDQTVLVADGMAHSPVPTQELLENPPPSLRAYLGT